MYGFYLLCLLSVLALPSMIVWYAGLELLAPLFWRLKLLGKASSPARRLLTAPDESNAHIDRPVTETQLLINEITATKQGWFTRDYSMTRDPFDIHVRTQVRAVDESGAGVGIPYTLEEISRTHSVVAMWIIIPLRGLIPPGLTFHLEASFEERALGDERLIAALMNGRTRNLMGHGDRLYLSDECLTLEAPFLLRERQPMPVIEGLLEVAHRLSRVATSAHTPPDVASLLIENLSDDQSELVRAKAADLLLSRYKDHRSAASVALKDPAPAVRFAAARHMSEEGFPIIEAIIFEPTGGDLNSEGLRQRALRFMIREYTTERILPILERVIREGSDGLRQISIRHVGKLRHQPAIAWLTPLPRSRDTETITAGCEALAQIPNPSAEALLIELLNRPEPSIIRAAIDAIAQIGTMSSSSALSHLASHGSTRIIRTAAATTLQLVRTRDLPEGAGQLSLIDGHGSGALSIIANKPSG